MIICATTPTPLLAKQFNTEIEFAEGLWCLQDPTYFKHFAVQECPVILDNSAALLDEPLAFPAMVGLARHMASPILISPDYQLSGPRTLWAFARAYNMIKTVKERGHIKLLAVAQGRTLPEFLIAYTLLAKMADVIGIGRQPAFTVPGRNPFKRQGPSMDTWYGLNRYNLFCLLERIGILAQDVPHHVLGLNTPLEIVWMSRFKCIKSLDTSQAWVLAHVGRKVPSGAEALRRFRRPSFALHQMTRVQTVTPEEEALTTYNVMRLRGLANFGELYAQKATRPFGLP